LLKAVLFSSPICEHNSDYKQAVLTVNFQ